MPDNFVSIDLGSSNIHLLEGRYHSGVFAIKRAALCPLEPGAHRDGKITDVKLLKNALATALSKEGIRAKKVILTVQSSSVMLRDFLLPAAKAEELRGMVEYEIEQYLPAPLGEYAVDFKVLGREPDSGKLKIRAAVIPRGMADNYRHLLQEIKLRPQVLDIQFNAVDKLFSEPISVNGAALPESLRFAVADIGAQNIGISLFAGRQSVFTRLIPLGSRDIDREIAGAFGVSLERAEEAKKDVSLAESDPGAAGEGMRRIARAHVDEWIGEIRKVLSFHASQAPGNGVDKLFLCGGGCALKGLPAHIEASLGIPVERIKSIGLCGKELPSQAAVHLNALGAMIRKRSEDAKNG